MKTEELVTVVIAAYNAENTINQTLHSVRAQTYRSLEILVVDDGSTDRTSNIIDKHMKADPRVRLIEQSNGGVASARNRAIAEAKSQYIAPIDADDLWSPTKISKQMDLMLGLGHKIGLVYTWHAVIDRKSRITSMGDRPDDEGIVLPRLCLGNLIGNGSSALMRKTAVLESGCYDVSLRSQGAEGCEDWKLYFRIAERHEFAVVQEHLTYYRVMAGNMSSDALQMLRSHDLVASEFRQTYPQYSELFRENRRSLLTWLIRISLLNFNLSSATVLAIKLFKDDYRFALKFLVKAMIHLARRIRPRGYGVIDVSVTSPGSHVP